MVEEQTQVSKKKQDRLIGTTIADRYEILSVVGHGATTSVYKARDSQRNRPVVIKMLHTHSIASEITVRRFEQECKTLALLKHPNIVAHYDNGVTDQDQPFLVMEHLHGATLKELLEEKVNLDIETALPIFIEACAGLSAAHEKDIVHRDMKPANIMVSLNEQGKSHVKILDFGVAKLLIQGETFQTKTQTGEMLGTLLYMSPEQCLDQDLDGRSDVYSLGCVLYEALTGKPPLCGRTAFETMNKHLSEKPNKLSIVRPDLTFPVRLERIVQKSMEKDPSQRYQSINMFEEQLKELLKETQTHPSILQPSPELTNKSTRTVLPLLVEEEEEAAADDEPFLNAEPAVQTSQALDGDQSREGTINFIANESMDGVTWRRIYADTLKTYSILDKEILDEQSRIVSRQYNLKEMEKFALEKFNSLDQNSDGFITKEELRIAWKSGRHSWRESGFITFLLHHLDDIRFASASESHGDGLPSWPKSPNGISIQDIQEYFKLLSNSARAVQT